LNQISPRVEELGVTQIEEFLENESLTTDFSETQQINNMLCGKLKF